MTAPAARRRRPWARAALVLSALITTGFAYTALAPGQASAQSGTADTIAAGKALFLANCASCHGLNAQGRSNAPSLVGVGAAAVDFQVGTGRMPLSAMGVQAPVTQNKFSQDQIDQMAAYIASLGPGPSQPDTSAYDQTQGDPSRGAEIFRVNCAMCHNFAGKGGALTHGKYAPALDKTMPKHIYEAMLTGPQSMPVFNDQTMDPQSKRDIIAYLTTIRKEPSPGGLSLGTIGPVSEGLVAWVIGLSLLIGCAVWLGSKAS